MSLIDIDSLLRPIEATAPCGPELDYDPLFIELEEAAREPDKSINLILVGGAPDWRAVFDMAVTLFARTKDLRVAVILLRAAVRVNGLRELEGGLRVIEALLATCWDAVHPALDVEDSNDATARLNALAPLGDAGPLHADLREMLDGEQFDDVTNQRAEAASAAGSSDRIEDSRSPRAIWEAFRAEAIGTPRVAECLRSAADALLRIKALLRDRVGWFDYPDFDAPRTTLLALAARTRADARALGAPDHTEEAEVRPASPAAAPAMPAQSEEALRQLQRVCDWIERDSSMQSLSPMLRRARRLSARSFMQIVRIVASDRSDEIDHLADLADRPRAP